MLSRANRNKPHRCPECNTVVVRGQYKPWAIGKHCGKTWLPAEARVANRLRRLFVR